MGVWVACAIWSSPVSQSYDLESTLELRRMAISNLCPKNTATHLIRRMIKDIDKKFPLVTKLISYQDTEYHNGTIYKASNWYVDGVTKFNTWSKSRKRSKDQSVSDKIRWAYDIKKNHNIQVKIVTKKSVVSDAQKESEQNQAQQKLF